MKTPKPLSTGEETFALQLRAEKLGEWEREYQFDKTRKWRFDFVNKALGLAVEIDGGAWSAGRHTRGAGYTNDCEKLAEAVILGWLVMRFTNEQVASGYAIYAVKRFMERK